MLDKTVPYVEFWMVRETAQPVPKVALPSGFRATFYQPGDEVAWGKIETAVGEFEAETAAAAYFTKTFAPYSAELASRMLFIENAAGDKVGTCTAWWSKENQPLVHWLAVIPTEQGQGLAKYLISTITNLLLELGEGQPVILHTQTWSHPAVRLYQKLGYEIAPIGEFKQAKQVLEQLRKR